MENKKIRFFGIGRIIPYVKNFKREFVIMIVFSIIASGIEITFPQFHRYALDSFVGKGTLSHLGVFVVMYALAILLAGLFNYYANTTAAITEVRVHQKLRDVGFVHLQTLSFAYFNQNSVGYIHARLMSDTEKIGTLVSWTLINGIWYLAYLVGSAVMMLMMNVKLALLVLTILPVLMIIVGFFQKKLITANREVREINSRITGNFNEGIAGAKTIKSLAIEDKISENFVEETAKMKSKSVYISRLRGAFGAAMNFASSIALAVVLFKGGYLAEDEVGMFAAFMSYAQGMMEPVRWLVNVISELIAIRVNIERFTNLLEEQSDVKDSDEVVKKYGDTLNPKKENWEPVKGDIEFKDVTFRYPDGEVNVLEHFSLNVPFGTHLAIVGETGAGKSTLVNLACRFYEPTKGQVLIDGRDARERSQLWLHSSIGYVLQTPHLFSGTVRDNLLMGKSNASDEEINRALKLVSADEVVARLENGLDTDVGEGGDLLSTGEKQLISFARAVLADPKILILDEATASVDTMTEAKIQAAMDTVTQGRTSIMIAHRLSTVRNADIILVVKDGVIVERGTHSELINSRGYYFDLYTRQYEDEATAKILA
ncbi:MAG TPA: ABC transporter ATP-binding protein [Ruminococcaceae bacterium]|mgnify:FL=1|nr:ABC transporter ATP-binding protein [Oscillospiraceae bacterium]